MAGSASNEPDDEVRAVASLLVKLQPESFRKTSPSTLETDAREALILASVVPEAFFLRRNGEEVEAYPARLERGFASKWLIDIRNEYEELFEGPRKVVKFFGHWVPEKGYAGDVSGRKRTKREKEMFLSLLREVEVEGKDVPDVLFVPTINFENGRQLPESLYHYVAGLVFRNMGYLVIDEYTPTLMTGTARTPDLSAFRTPEIVEMMKGLRAKGIVSGGAFLQELQFHGVFGRKGAKGASPSREWTDAESVAIEVKRGESESLVASGSRQLTSYLSEAYGFYDEGYLSGPFMSGQGTISMDMEGNLVFERSSPSTTPAETDFWRERKVAQFKDVKVNAVLELLKGSGMISMIETIGKDDVDTYEGLLGTFGEIATEDLMRLL